MDADFLGRYGSSTEQNQRSQTIRRARNSFGGIVLAAATAVVVQSFAAAGPPVTVGPVELVSRSPETNQPTEGNSVEPTMSALGHIVTFETDQFVVGAGSSRQSSFRDRPSGVSVRPDPTFAANSAVSDDGCVIAYSGPTLPATTAPFRELRVRNRCAGGVSAVTSVFGSAIVPRPALSADGSRVFFIVGGTTIGVFGGSTLLATVTAPNSKFLISDVAVSDDGNLVAFTAGPEQSGGSIMYDQSNVYVFDLVTETYALASIGFDGGRPFPLGRAQDVSMSGDGSLVAFNVNNVPFVYDRTTNSARPVFAGGSQQSISNDGRSLVFRFFAGDNSDIFLIRTSNRWQSTTAPELITVPLPAFPGSFRGNSDPVVSEHGRWVSWSSRTPEIYVSDPAITPNTFDQVLIRERRPRLTVDSIDFGLTPSPTTRDSTVRNVGASGWRVTSIATTGGAFAVDSHTCPAVLHPDETCTIRVRYAPSGSVAQTGEVIVRDDSYPGIPLSATGRLVGVPVPPGTTTTLPGATTTTLPGATTTTTLPVIVVPDFGLSIAPDPVQFDSAVVGVPAAARAATVTNTGETSVTVQTITLSGVAAADYSIVLDGCTGTSLAVGASCALTVGFVPSAAGLRTGALSVAGTVGTSASTNLRGEGAFDAALSVTPELVAPGQVATLVGSGFPASTAVSVTLGDGVPISVTTDGTGAFMTPWLVLGGTPQGELLGDDVAVVGVYDAEPAPLQVVGTPMRPQSTRLISRTQRSYVSR